VVRAEVGLPEALRGRKLDLMVALFETGLVTEVGRGENGGHTLKNDYVVRDLKRAGKLSPRGPERTEHTAEISLEREWNASRLGVAAFLQDPGSLEIYGGSARLIGGPVKAAAAGGR
jgi:hypothetical protein